MGLNEQIKDAVTETERRFRVDAAGWLVLKRNLAIQGRNRNIVKLNEMLGTDFEEMPLERPEVEP